MSLSLFFSSWRTKLARVWRRRSPCLCSAQRTKRWEKKQKKAKSFCCFDLNLCVCVNVFMQKNQGILLGVVGTDIPLHELTKLIPKHMVGSAVLLLSLWNKWRSSDAKKNTSVSAVRDPRLRLRHHQQRLHTAAPRPPTSGNRLLRHHSLRQSHNNPWL